MNSIFDEIYYRAHLKKKKKNKSGNVSGSRRDFLESRGVIFDIIFITGVEIIVVGNWM